MGVVAEVLGPLLIVVALGLGVRGWFVRRRNSFQRLYEEWLDDIAEDERFDLASLLQHIHHHTDEATTEGMSVEWLASMVNLLAIIKRKQGLEGPSLRLRLERLYLHWQNDPANTTPPPIVKSLRRTLMLLGVPGPPPEGRPPSRPRIETPSEEEVRVGSQWHGS